MGVKRGDLGPLKELASGGFGKVYRVLNYHLPGDPADLAYKEFTTDVAQQAHASRAAVAFRDGLGTTDRADLDQYTAWPRAVVEDNGSVVGLLMPLIAKDFRFGTMTRAGTPTTVASAGTSLTTTLPDPIRACSPTWMAPRIQAFDPMTTLFPTCGWRTLRSREVPPKTTPL